MQSKTLFSCFRASAVGVRASRLLTLSMGLGVVLLLSGCGCRQMTSLSFHIIGDSLTEGSYIRQPYPALLADELERFCLDAVVTKSSRNGARTADGFGLLDQTPNGVDVILIALGGNDYLRGIPESDTEENLIDLIREAQTYADTVILVGLQSADHQTEVFARAASATHVPLISNLLEGVVGVSRYNLPDGIHPNQRGHQRMARHMAREIDSVLQNNRRS